MKYFIRHILRTILFFICVAFLFIKPCIASKYEKHLSSSEKETLCQQLKSQQASSIQGASSLGGGIIPDNVLTSIYNTTKNINDKVALLLTMGHALTCHAVHAGKNSVEALGITLLDYPDFSVWICGGIVYIVGFMLTLSISFYVADIAFKLGFAVIMLPIGIALWPFPITKDRLATLISIILKNAGIFIFLAITVSYALTLVDTATNLKMPLETEKFSEQAKATGIDIEAEFLNQSGIKWSEAGGMQKLFFMISNNMTDAIAENFTLFSTYFLVILFALIYGFKLIGSTIVDYVDKFFPDKAFGGGMGASPIHGMMTQSMDFIKKNTVDRAASWAGDVAMTQVGRVARGTGNLMAGKYNKTIRHYVRNPGDINKNIAGFIHSTGGSIAKGTSSLVTGTVGRIILGNEARKDLQNKINSRIDKAVGYLDDKADNVATRINEKIQDRRENFQNKMDNLSEKFDNSAVGQKLNQIQQTHKNIQSAYEKRLESLKNRRQKVNDGVNNFNKGITNFRTNTLKSIDNLETKYIQFNNRVRNNITKGIGKGYQAINEGIFRKNDDDGIIKKGGKALARGILRGSLSIVDGTHRLTSGVVTLPLNIAATAVGGTAKAATKLLTGVASAPANIVGGVMKTPYIIAEGALRATNVTKNVQHAKKATKSIWNATGEILAKTGDKMTRNKVSEQERRQKLQRQQEEYEKAKREEEAARDL